MKRTHITVSFNPNAELDREILPWISGIPRRYRSTVIKAVLYRWLKDRKGRERGEEPKREPARPDGLEQLSDRLLEVFKP